MRKFKNKKGFTIVELVVVIAVIGVLTAILVPTFVTLSKRAQVANMQSFVTNINKKLAMNASTQGKNATMHDAQLDAKEIGFDIEKITPFDGHDIIWDSDSDRFMLVKGDEIVLKDNSTELNSLTAKTKKKLFKVAKDANELSDGYSHYLAKNEKWESSLNGGQEKVKFEAGVDVGDNEGISEINYERSSESEGQEVIIRTNGGTLTINAGEDTIKHYGTAQVVTLTAVGTNSYYENGAVNQVSIKKGRLVLTNNEDASVGTVYLQATGETYDNIILATQNGSELPGLIARDNVPLPTGDESKKVVTIQTNVNEEGKQPEKTETINLYSTKGESGNDVYEADNGYNVSSLALLVVEASSTAAKEQAAEQISTPAVVAQVTESKSAVEVDTEEEMIAALNAKAKYIKVIGSFDTTKAFLIKGSTIIEGVKLPNNTYPLITSKASVSKENTGFSIDESNIDVTLRYLSVDVRNHVTISSTRGIQINNTSRGVKLLVDGCDISATHYAFNVTNNAEVDAVFVNSHLLGYGALNLWHADYTVKVTNCVLEGIQNGHEGFAVVVLEGDTTGKTDMHSTSVTVQIDSSELIATCNDTTGGYEAFIGFNTQATANVVKLNNSTLTSKGLGITKTVYDSGTSNKLYFDNELFDIVKYENELFDKAVEENRETVAAEKNNAVLYYWINANGSKSGGYYSIEIPFNNGYVMDGEYIVLMEHIVLTANSNGSSSLNGGDSFTFITNGYTVSGGTIKLGTNVTAVSDSGTLNCFANGDGSIIVAVNNGDGTYSYSGK